MANKRKRSYTVLRDNKTGNLYIPLAGYTFLSYGKEKTYTFVGRFAARSEEEALAIAKKQSS